MDRIGLIDGYDESKSREILNLLPQDRQNEFRELAVSRNSKKYISCNEQDGIG